MGNSVRMMLMGVTLYHALRVNSVMTTLHHWLEQNVPVLMVIFLMMIQNVLVSYVAMTIPHTLYHNMYYFQQTLMSAPIHQLLIVLNSVLILLVVMSVIVMMATEQLLIMLHSVKV